MTNAVNVTKVEPIKKKAKSVKIHTVFILSFLSLLLRTCPKANHIFASCTKIKPVKSFISKTVILIIKPPNTDKKTLKNAEGFNF